MGLTDLIFGGSGGPSERQIRRATKAIIEPHGDPSGRSSAAERLIEWQTAESLYAALLRFTIQVPSITIDQSEKEELSKLLIQVGQPIVEPILKYMRIQTDVRWPCEILQGIVTQEEYTQHLIDTLCHLQDMHLRDEEYKARLIQLLPRPGTEQSRNVVAEFVENDNDEVAIAAVDFLMSEAGDELRQKLIQVLIDSEGRPRVQAWIAEVFTEHNWSVRPRTSDVEKILPGTFYLTSKGVIKHRSTQI